MPNDLVREVFGGSESELSSDEDDHQLPQQPQQQQQNQHQHQHQPPVRARARDEAYDSSGESDDEYAHGKPAKAGKQARGGRGEGATRRPVQRKRKRKAPVEVDLSQLPPEQANKMRLDMQIEAILKTKKRSTLKKRNKANEEVLDSFADDEVARLRETMNAAADEDIRANQEKLPATAKLKLLPEAMDTLRKASLAQSMIDNNLLEAVKRWLEPLPDRSLPALNIQREFFHLLPRLEFIDSAVLKESGLGRIVLFYTKCKRLTPDVRRTAAELVSTWSRPIIKRSASYRDRIVPTADMREEAGGGGGGGPGRGGEKLNAILARAREGDKGRVKRNAVSIPQRELGSYTVAPRPGVGIGGRGGASVDVDVERRRKNAERLRSLTRKVGGMK